MDDANTFALRCKSHEDAENPMSLTCIICQNNARITQDAYSKWDTMWHNEWSWSETGPAELRVGETSERNGCVSEVVFVRQNASESVCAGDNCRNMVDLSMASVRKLHKALWHASADVMWRYMEPICRRDGLPAKAMKSVCVDIVRDCVVCRKVSTKLGPQPRLTGVVPKFTNDWVAMDTLVLKGAGATKWIGVHMVDMFIRWSMLTVTDTGKVSSSTICKAYALWASHFG